MISDKSDFCYCNNSSYRLKFLSSNFRFYLVFFKDSARSIFKMEVSGGSGNGGQYVGVAFSPNGQMENSDLYYCTGDRLISGVINTRVQPTVTTSLPVRLFVTTY